MSHLLWQQYYIPTKVLDVFCVIGEDIPICCWLFSGLRRVFC